MDFGETKIVFAFTIFNLENMILMIFSLLVEATLITEQKAGRVWNKKTNKPICA